MSKEYFSHDYNARSDPKLARILMKLGTEGIGIYWCIIEMLYEQNGYIKLNHIETIAFELHQQCERITSVLKDFDLFRFEDDFFYSESVLNRLQLRTDKSKKASSAATIRWTNHANALRTHSKRNAIKVNKSKEKERKEIKEKKFLEDSELNLLFIDFLNMREKIKKPATEKAIELLLANLNKLSSNKEEQKAILEQSIIKNYQGLFSVSGFKRTSSNSDVDENGRKIIREPDGWGVRIADKGIN